VVREVAEAVADALTFLMSRLIASVGRLEQPAVRCDHSALVRPKGTVAPDPGPPPAATAWQEQLVGEWLQDESWLTSRLVDSLVRR
jgi:hypothetical protein